MDLLLIDYESDTRAATTFSSAVEAAARELAPISDSSRLDAEVLLAHLLGESRTFLRTWPDRTLSLTQLHSYCKLVAQRRNGCPIAYLTGTREFWSMDFNVNPAVLIPRPETELLVESALDLYPVDRQISVLDLGTGSGIVGIAIARERPQSQVLCTDISLEAIRIAQGNASKFSLNNICFIESDWFKLVTGQKFDLIVSNPPYIADNDPYLDGGDLLYEPKIALRSGPRGLDALRVIADQARARLKSGGFLLLEHGFDQGPSLERLLSVYGYQQISRRKDLQGHPRMTLSRWLDGN
ncbi:MAG: peptide chain release factor N(5)-glutamine methyltransferase [Pseudomonadota bacterium]|nr:peptide chain release factor N(5)-glutamine methyltransferase [Pseudomonadota bacterium]